MHRRLRPWIAALALAAVLAPALGRADELYPIDLRKRFPAALRAHRKVVPAKLRRVRWIYDLSGTAGPVREVELGGRAFLVGSVCKPHDCGGNTHAFLVARDGSVAFGLLRSERYAPKGDLTFGKPGEAERRLLVQELGDDGSER